MAKKVNQVKASTYDVQAYTDTEISDASFVTAMNKASANLPSNPALSRQNTSYQNLMNNQFYSLNIGFAADGSGMISVPEAIRLCQLAYFNHGVIGNVIDVMQEFTVGSIDFLAKKKSPREILLGWASGIKLKSFIDQCALEYYRSGNVFIYRFESVLKDSSLRNLKDIFSVQAKVKIPVKYTLINPTLVKVVDSGLLNRQQYIVTLPASEVMALAKAFQDDQKSFEDMPPEFKEAMQRYMGGNSRGRPGGDLVIRLNPDNVIAIHRKKQPYERYAVPFLAKVLDDVMFKKELRNMDRALARTMARILIHVKVGTETLLPSREALQAMTDKLANSSTSSYLITDGTVSINQYYPDISKLLDSHKYDAVNQDIFAALGISPAAFGADSNGSFSNNFLGIKMLVERIGDGRQKILEDFLIPETKRVVAAFNLKTDVVPEIIGVDLNDEKEWAKIYTHLYEVGVFSPQSTIESIREGRVPTYDEEVDRQAEALAQKEEGLWQPNINRGGNSPDAGRPTGTKNPPQTSPKKPSPRGNSLKARAFSQDEFDDCYKSMSSILKKANNIKVFDQKQIEAVKGMCRDFLVSEPFSEDGVAQYLEKFRANPEEKV